MKRLVVTTSTSCLDYLKVMHDIKSLHQNLTINNVTFLDGKNISVEKLLQLITLHPHSRMYTSPQSYEDSFEIFKDLQDHGYDEVLVLTHAATLSQSFNIINEVKANLTGPMTMYVFDTCQINISQGLVALDVADMFMHGASLHEIRVYIDTLNQAHRALYVADTLEYLITSKRLIASTGFFADLLDIKPVVEVKHDGSIKVIDRVRKIECTIDKMIDYATPQIEAEPNFIYLLSAGNSELVNYTQWKIEAKFGITDLVVTPVSPVSLATHGPHTVGLGTYVGHVPRSAALLSTDAFN